MLINLGRNVVDGLFCGWIGLWKLVEFGVTILAAFWLRPTKSPAWICFINFKPNLFLHSHVL